MPTGFLNAGNLPGACSTCFGFERVPGDSTLFRRRFNTPPRQVVISSCVQKSLFRGRRQPVPRQSLQVLCSHAGRVHDGDHHRDHHHHHHHHHHDHSHSHETLGCCSSNAKDTTLSNEIREMLSFGGFLDLVHELEHSTMAIGVSASVLILSTFCGWLSGGEYLGQIGSLCEQAGLVVVFLLSATPLLVDGVLRVAKGQVDTHVLMALAVCGSLYLGLPHEGALLLLLFQGSHVLEDKFTKEAEYSLKGLLDSVPEQATLVKMTDRGSPDLAKVDPVKAEDVAIGSHVLILPGEQVPLDGIVIYGQASVTVDHISGESLPVRIKQDDQISAGSRNNDGVLVVKTTQTAENSTPARIAQLAIDARASKPKVQKWIDDVTSTWSQGVLFCSLGVLAGCLFLGIPLMGERGSLYRAMGVVTAGAPCALVMTPLAYVCALANATKRRILIKGAAVLDSIYGCNVIGVDKTGTLTKGNLTCTAILSSRSPASSSNGLLNGGQHSAEKQALAHAVALSQRSSHPVALAITEAGRKLDVNEDIEVEDFELIPGAGVTGVIFAGMKDQTTKRVLHFGSIDFIQAALPAEYHAELNKVLQDLGTLGKSISVLLETWNGEVAWSIFSFEDQVRANSGGAVEALTNGAWISGSARRDLAKRVVMLTGDAASSAEETAFALGISEVHSELKPEHKLQHIVENAPADGGGRNFFMMVGDGLNDAPALSEADVGVAVASTASDASASVADVVILNGQGVGSLPFLMRLAQETRIVVVQNLVLTFASMAVATVPTVAGFFPLWVAVLLHEGTTLLTAINSLRLLMIDPASSSSEASAPSLGTFKRTNDVSKNKEKVLGVALD
ncbi:hypothetical protein BSKO_07679 [Bryopsis sp. KO-2023]|nr:hypothetical protein BSKO_07679 [Bryopsis sp. KO-2023]